MTEITIIIDKSTFQSLSYLELLRLNSYYKHNVAPVLVMEILGDLSKETTDGKPSPKSRVIEFATKLFPMQVVVSSHYRSLVKGELTGQPVSFDGRPHLDVEKAVVAEDGKKGFVIKQTDEEKAIYKWKAGKFSEADAELSHRWRTITTQDDLLKNLKETLRENGSNEKLNSVEELVNKVQAVLANPQMQDALLGAVIHNYGDGKLDGVEAYRNWLTAGSPLITEYAPYAAHCLKVDLLFHYGLRHDLIGTRPTNRVDMEYLYYLPFCRVFTSNDKFHKKLAPLLLRDNQEFVTGEALKEDLKCIVANLEAGGIDRKRQFANKPPIIENSLTFELWKKEYGYPEKERLRQDPEQLEYIKKQMQKFTKAMEGGAVDFKAGEHEQFIVKKSYMTANDPCYCGSGKQVIDCCIPPEKFKEMSEPAE